MKKHVHFIPSYVCLRDFLSVYDKNCFNIIIYNKRYEELVVFLKSILPKNNNAYVVIEEIYLKGYVCNKYRKYGEAFIKEYLADISETDEVFFYCDRFTLSIFLVLNEMKGKCRINFIDSEPEVRYYKIKGIKNRAKELVLKYCNYFNNIELEYIHIDFYTIKWVHDTKEYHFDKLVWPLIKEKFDYQGFNIKTDSRTNILYIHQNLHLICDDYSKSVKNLCGFFHDMIKSGRRIYFKNHPNNAEDISYIYEWIENENIIPEFIPVELAGDGFDEYYTFNSLGIRPFLNKKCFTLYNYLVFDSEEKAKEMKYMLDDNLGNIIYFNRSVTEGGV